MEDQQEVIDGVSNTCSVIFNNLQCPLTPVSRSRFLWWISQKPCILRTKLL